MRNLTTVAGVMVILAAGVFIFDWAKKQKAEADAEARREAEFCEPSTLARMSKTCELKCSLIDSSYLRDGCNIQCLEEDIAVLEHCNERAKEE